jgi:hypothetical protein
MKRGRRFRRVGSELTEKKRPPALRMLLRQITIHDLNY